MMRIIARAAALSILVFGSACERRQATRETTSESGTSAAPQAAAAIAVDWAAVDEAIGRAGVVQAGDVHRFNFPRGDMRVVAGGVTLKPALALGGWIAFKAVSDGVIAMGDLVLSENEINPVISALQSGGVEQTALHHHVLHESPRVLYLHVHAHGKALEIAGAIRTAVALTKAPPPAAPAPTPAPADIGIDTAKVAAALGYSGRVNGGVYQVGVPRAESIRDGGFEIPPTMGLATAINFQPTGAGKAAITGDFVLLASEVNPVIRVLRENGIEITSLHSHLIDEQPRLLFMHFWANDDAVRLAGALRSALAKTNSKQPGA